MNKMSVKRSLSILTFIAVFFITMCTGTISASARGEIDLSQTGDLSLTYQCNETEDDNKMIAIKGENVSIYKIADVSRFGEFTLCDEYANIDNFPVTDINKIKDQDTWKEISDSIAGYIYYHNIQPSATATTDENGLAHFTGIELGLYLVGNISHKSGDCLYSFSSFIISVPGLDENDDWINPAYYVVGTVKCKKTIMPHEITYELLKTWDDAGYEDKRPTSITVTLYCDGNEYDTVTLGQENNWRYSWTYEEGHEWTMAEHVEGELTYTSSLLVSGVTYRLANTYTPPDTPDTPTTPDTPDSPTPDTPDTPGFPDLPEVLGAIRDLPAVLGARRLPQTGQLWWPLPILLIVGIIFIVKGIRKNLKTID